MARCENCNKFVSYDEPEVESIEAGGDPDVTVTDDKYNVYVEGDVRVVLNCADCGSELKSTDIDWACNVDLALVKPDLEPSLLDDFSSVRKCYEIEIEVTDEQGDTRTEGKDRGRKTFYGFAATVLVTVSDAVTHEPVAEGEAKISDYTQASNMDDSQ